MERESARHPRTLRGAPSSTGSARSAWFLLLAALCFGISAKAYAASLAEQMGKAMARMMDSYSSSSQEKRSGNSAFDYPSGPQGWNNMSPPGMGGMPWGGMSPWGGGTPWGSSRNPWPMPEQFPGNTGMPNWPGSAAGGGNQPLNGAWISNTGQGLIIRGNRFRLLTDRERYRDMVIRYEGNQIWLYDQDSGTAKRYEFAHAKDRMALRDHDGNTMLFRRRNPSGE